MKIASEPTTNDAGVMAQAAAPAIARLSELAEAESELAKLLAHEDAKYDALANEDEAEALKRWSGSQSGDTRAHSFGILRVIGRVVRGLFGIPSGRRPAVCK